MSKLIHYSGPAGSYILPSGYIRLAWIEGNGNSYIDTGWKYTSGDMTVDIEYTMPTNNNVTVIGSSNDNTKWATLIYHYNGVRLYYCGTQSAAYSKAITAGTKINTIYGISGSNVFIKDERYNTVNKTGYSASCGTIPSQSYTYTLFCHHYSNTYTQIAACKMYHCNIWDKGVLIRQYVPVKTTSAVTNAYGTSSSVGTCGMLDLVNNSFYPSKTSTGFTGSVEVIPGFPTSEYCQVEWLEGIGNQQYINTGVKPSATLCTRLVYSNPSYNSNIENIFFGASSQLIYNKGSNYCMETFGNNNTWWAFGSSCTACSSINWISNQIYNIELNYNGSGQLKIDGVVKATRSGQTSFPDLNLFLFGRNVAGSVDSTYSKYRNRLHRVQFFNSTTLIHDYIPCYRRSDMKPGMYDLISRTFLTNSGTGEFLLGPSITFGWGEVRNGSGWGINLWRGQPVTSPSTSWPTLIVTPNGVSGMAADWTDSLRYRITTPFPCNGQYTVSGKYKQTYTEGRLLIWYVGGTRIGSSSSANNEVTFSHTFIVNDCATQYLEFRQEGGNNGGYIKDLRIEMGATTHSDSFSSHAIPHNISSGSNHQNLINSAFQFDGTSSYISANIPGIVKDKNPWTIAYWYKRNGATTYDPHFCFDLTATKGICIRGNNFERGDGTTNYDKAINGVNFRDNNWHHVALTYDGTNVRIFDNGVLKDTIVAPSAGFGTTNTIYFGKFWAGYGNALIENIQIWNEKLSDTIIPTLM